MQGEDENMSFLDEYMLLTVSYEQNDIHKPPGMLWL